MFVYLILAWLMTCPPRIGPTVMLVWGSKKGGIKMARRTYRPEQIINKLREAEVLLSQAVPVQLG